MKPEDLRRQLAAKQPQQEERPNGIDFYTDPKVGKVMFKFHHSTDNFMLNREQLKPHIDTLIMAAKSLGIPFAGEIRWLVSTAGSSETKQ